MIDLGQRLPPANPRIIVGISVGLIVTVKEKERGHEVKIAGKEENIEKVKLEE